MRRALAEETKWVGSAVEDSSGVTGVRRVGKIFIDGLVSFHHRSRDKIGPGRTVLLVLAINRG